MDLGHSIWTKDQHKVMSYVICNRCNSAGHDSSLCPQKVDRLKTAVSVTCYSFGERGGGVGHSRIIVPMATSGVRSVTTERK